MQNAEELIMLFENIYAFRDTEVCVLFTHTLLSDIFISFPSSGSLVLFIPMARHGGQKTRRLVRREA